jgi:hypothetical protein
MAQYRCCRLQCWSDFAIGVVHSGLGKYPAWVVGGFRVGVGEGFLLACFFTFFWLYVHIVDTIKSNKANFMTYENVVPYYVCVVN